MVSERGRQAEQIALDYLQSKGLRLLARNWQCRRGELDLVMLDGATLVFVEVRYRKHQAWGGALASIDARKRDKLITTARYFLSRETRWSSHPCRFDVLALGPADLDAGAPAQEPIWISNAFEA